MRYNRVEGRRIAALGLITLLIAAALVFRGIGDDTTDDSAAQTPAPTVAPTGPSAASQVAESGTQGGGIEPSVDGSADDPQPEEPIDGPGTFTGALTGFQFGPPNPDIELQFSVAVEDNIGVDATELSRIVDQVLSDPRSWAASSRYSLVRVPTGGIFQLVVASPSTTDEICAPLQTIGQLSCAIDSVVAINLTRWETGSRSWTGSLDDYRAWVINHEIGHQLNLTHRSCGEPGEVADVMQQQSIDLDGCTANPWPFPEGVDPATEPTPTPTPIPAPTSEADGDTTDGG